MFVVNLVEIDFVVFSSALSIDMETECFYKTVTWAQVTLCVFVQLEISFSKTNISMGLICI